VLNDLNKVFSVYSEAIPRLFCYNELFPEECLANGEARLVPQHYF